MSFDQLPGHAQNEATEAMIQQLNNSGDYRVIRRLVTEGLTVYDEPLPGEEIRTALVVDTETTGLSPDVDDIIELGMVKFEFGVESGRVLRIVDTLDMLEDPGRPLDPVITEVTGLTDADVAGKYIDDDAVLDMLEGVQTIIAHNAGFDRRFCEKRIPAMMKKAWACSLAQIPWRKEAGAPSAKLEFLAYMQGFFYPAHRAENDCRATLHLLAGSLFKGARHEAFKTLRANCGRRTVHLWLDKLPFESKDAAKNAGYVWGDGTDGRPKAWNKEVYPEDIPAEIAQIIPWYEADKNGKGAALLKEVVGYQISPLDRFSLRMGTEYDWETLQRMAERYKEEVPATAEDTAPTQPEPTAA